MLPECCLWVCSELLWGVQVLEYCEAGDLYGFMARAKNGGRSVVLGVFDVLVCRQATIHRADCACHLGASAEGECQQQQCVV